jgi:hypothetical protein
MIRALPCALLLAGCLGSAPQTDGGADAASDARAADASPDAPARDLAGGPADFAGVDLAGLVLCYGAAVCDPAMQFCLRYYAGPRSAPGMLVNGPSCFEPSDTCANLGQNMDCGCIQNDPNLQGGCADCLDHGDGTYDCFAR